jgi:dTMP kinase
MSQQGKSRGFFITLEGPEGSGKSSQARWLAAWLRRQGCRVVAVRDPGSTALGRVLRRVLLHSAGTVSPVAEALLFIGGRVQLVTERIRPALARGAVVVCDRFHDSTIAYQGFGGGLEVTWLSAWGRRAIAGVMPDLTLVLDVPVEVGLARRGGRRADRMERKTPAFHRRVRQGYLALAKQEPRRILLIDATAPVSVVRQRIAEVVSSRLPNAREVRRSYLVKRIQEP